MSTPWPIMRLGDVCSFDKHTGKHVGLPYVGMEDIESNTGQFIGNLSPREMKSSTFKFSTKHVLFGRLRPYLNKVMVPDFNGHCSSEIFPILPNELVLQKYLQYWLLMDSTVSMIDATSTGTRMPRANMNQVLEFEIPVPPPEEQQRIVGILDEAFNKLAGKSERIQDQILSIDNLFDGVLDSEYANQSEWNLATLDEIVESTFYGPRFAKDAYTPDGVVSLRTTDMADDGFFEFKDPPRIQLDAIQLEKYRLIDGDILIARSGSVGKCAIYTEDLGEAMPSAYLIRMRLNKGLVHPGFVLRYLLSKTGQRHLIGHSTSSTMANINSKNLRNIPFSFPSLAEQMRIIEKMDGLYYESKTLKQTYQLGLNDLVELKQSLLQEALSGRLTGGFVS